MTAAAPEPPSRTRAPRRAPALLDTTKCPRCGETGTMGLSLFAGVSSCATCGYPGSEKRQGMLGKERDASRANVAAEVARRVKAEERAATWEASSMAEITMRSDVEKKLEKATAEIAELRQLVEDQQVQLIELSGTGADRTQTAPLPRGAVQPEPERVKPPGESTGFHNLPTDGDGYYPRAIDLSTGARRVLSVKLAEWAIEWLRDEGARAKGTRGGPSGMAARILESAAGRGADRSVSRASGNTQAGNTQSEAESK